MPCKLKDLKVTKVDFVDAGANQGANILLYKNKTGEATPIPAEGGEKGSNAVKKFFSAVAKAVGIGNESVDQVIDEIVKSRDAATFTEKMDEMKRRRITSEIWDVCYALEDSLSSIICDDEATDKTALMEQSLDEFSEVMKGLIPTWAQGKASKVTKSEHTVTPERAELLKSAKEKIELLIAKAGQKTPTTDEPEPRNESKKQKPCKEGANEDMKIDKSKLTAEEIAALEAIEKKAGIPEADPNQAVAGLDGVNKGKSDSANKTEEPEDIYKGLHPAVAAELKELRKRADVAEEREFESIAKKYEIIGKNAAELVPLFKSLKTAGGNAYDSMIAVLDASVAAVEKSGIFNEIGKRGTAEADAWTAIEKHADEIQKSKPDITRQEAIDKACQQHPELVHEYENNL